MGNKNSFNICFGSFDPVHTFECGQFFRFKKENDIFFVISDCHRAKIVPNSKGFLVVCDDEKYFKDFLDINCDYEQKKKELSKFPELKEAIEHGYGIRILNQPLFEMIVSFVISQNNNIKRIQKIVEALCEKCGKKIFDDFGCYYAFPTREEMLKLSEADFAALGFGYRAKYMAALLPKIDESFLSKLKTMSTKQARIALIDLPGIGPKVADCILLFGLHKEDTFPVDVWAERAFYHYFPKEAKNKEFANNRVAISNFLVKKFGNLSGLAQQYMFYAMRESGA